MAKPKAVRVPAKTEPTPDDVARRAYELYEARGSEPGAELEDWLRAERELRELADGTENEAA
ncbi:MAG: hypothetical protein DMF93_05710 [Acidobacteria bacterium]|nr:MAG: hypothetical protein DMF93_05710 [Acidobacteriota bacterium]